MKRMIAMIKQFLLWIGAAAMLLSMCVACQSAQPTAAENPTVQIIETVSADMDMLAPEAAVPAELPVFPERYVKTLSFDGLDVQIDAEIITPQLSEYPTYVLEPLHFTQEQADQMVAGLLGGVELYDETNTYNRKYIQGLIDAYEAEIAACAGNPEAEHLIPTYEGYIERLRKEYETAPEDASYTPASRTLLPKNTQIASMLYGTKKEHEDGGVSYEWSNEAWRRAAADGYGVITGVCFQPSGRKMELGIENKANSRVWFGTPDGGGAPIAGADFTQEEAKARGAALLADMGLDLEPLSIRRFVSPLNGKACYQLRYHSRIPGTAAADMTTLICYTSTPAQLFPGVQESILLMLDNEGIYSFQWNNPVRVKSLKEASVSLCPWENIAEIIDTMLGVKHFWQHEIERDDPRIVGRRIEINRIVLSYMQARDDTNVSEQTYIPVWNVCGRLIYRYDSAEDCGWIVDENNERVITTGNDRDEYSLLTINAIDGTVIDVIQGYYPPVRVLPAGVFRGA